jgi:hypothetical protein
MHKCPICDATFPCDGTVDDEPALRDAFASAALFGMLSTVVMAPPEEIATDAYAYADAMIRARKT